MNEFYLGVGLLFLVAILFLVFPWLRSTNGQETLTNTGIIRQRLVELEAEQEQGLLTASDREQSEVDLKLALLDELAETENTDTNGKLVLIWGVVVALAIGSIVYFRAQQIDKVQHWQNVKGMTSELGQRILSNDESLTIEDMQDFALGLRSRLLEKPEDPIGWMLLGRVSAAINRIDASIKAFEKSLEYDPNNTGTLASYAQALLITGDEGMMLQAKRVLLHILTIERNNTNAMGMLAVVASELGDRQLALDNWLKLREFVPKTDANYAAIGQRIEQLSNQLNGADVSPTTAKGITEGATASVNKRVEITVNISDALKDKLPKNGFLFVFAQDPAGKTRMPAAVVKMPLGTFPVVIELSNQNAMMPTFTLSQLDEAKLVARVSVDENVGQVSGELQGDTVVILSNVDKTAETILIDRIL